MLFSFGDDDDDIEEEDLTKLLESDMLEGMLTDVKSEFPKIGNILISERDQYLSDKIKKAPGKKVVAVLGGAHLAGVMEDIHKNIDLSEISTVSPKKPVGKIIGWAIPVIIIALFVFGFVTNFQTGLEQVGSWLFWNSCLAALFTLIALGHPLSILTSFVLAPFTSLNPLVAVGWFAGLVQASVQKPQVKDLHAVQNDIFSFKGFYRNKVLKVFMVVIFANIGSSIGTVVAGADIIGNLFG
jgi:pheromone shutdown-related protein TraB